MLVICVVQGKSHIKLNQKTLLYDKLLYNKTYKLL